MIEYIIIYGYTYFAKHTVGFLNRYGSFPVGSIFEAVACWNGLVGVNVGVVGCRNGLFGVFLGLWAAGMYILGGIFCGICWRKFVKMLVDHNSYSYGAFG